MKNSIDLSLPKDREVRGYTIKRAPLGAYLAAMTDINDAPKEMFAAVFPGMEMQEVLASFRTLTKDGLYQIIMRAISVLPGYVLRLVSKLTGIAEEKLKNDPAIGLDGLAEIMNAWLEVNGIENFLRALGPLWDKLRPMTRTGSNG